MSLKHSPPQACAFTHAAVWLGSTSLALLAGCVDGPAPPTSASSTEPAAVSSPESTLLKADLVSAPLAGEAEPTVANTTTPDEDGWIASSELAVPPNSTSPSPFPAPEPTRAEPTLAESRPTIAEAAPSLIPGQLALSETTPSPRSTAADAVPASVAPAPFPVHGEPTLADEEPIAPAPPAHPILANDAATPAPEGNPKPLEVAKSKGLILISPRNPHPLAEPASAASEEPRTTKETQQAADSLPAVVLPPSPVAEAAVLAPVQVKPLPTATEPPAAGPSLASIDPKAMASTLPPLPIVPGIKPLPITPATDSGESPTPTAPSNSTPPEGFVSLFNGQDLTGWEVFDGKSDSWKNENGEVSCVAAGGGWLQTLTQYSDFEMRFEYRLSSGGNSGVCLRFPGHGNPSLEGLEIQLIDDQAEKYHNIQPQQATGSLYFVTAPQVRDAARAAGEWNQCTLRCVGDQLQVTINDQLVNEIDLSQITAKKRADGQPAKPAPVRSPFGALALQSHSTRVDFRNLFVQDLTQSLESGVRWLDLQAGTGEAVPPASRVTVHYIGFLSTGKRFANSFEKGKPATVPLQDVIPGWRDGIPGMKVGGKRRLIVPASLAYGEKGFKEIVPPNSTLVYEIELVGFEKPADSTTPPAAVQNAAAGELETVK